MQTELVHGGDSRPHSRMLPTANTTTTHQHITTTQLQIITRSHHTITTTINTTTSPRMLATTPPSYKSPAYDGNTAAADALSARQPNQILISYKVSTLRVLHYMSLIRSPHTHTARLVLSYQQLCTVIRATPNDWPITTLP